jgi:hypothetical protein
MLYVMNDGYPLGMPSRSYVHTIIQGYWEGRDAGYEEFDTNELRKAIAESSFSEEEKRPKYGW